MYILTNYFYFVILLFPSRVVFFVYVFPVLGLEFRAPLEPCLQPFPYSFI
jgi:hypothetical protein